MKKFFPILAAALTLFATGCASESFTAETYEGEAQTVVLDLENTAVEVLPAEGELVRIEYYVSDKRGVAFSLDGGTLTVTSTAEGASVGALPNVSYRTVKVYVPAGIDALSLTTTGENVSLANISANASGESNWQEHFIFNSADSPFSPARILYFCVASSPSFGSQKARILVIEFAAIAISLSKAENTPGSESDDFNRAFRPDMAKW